MEQININYLPFGTILYTCLNSEIRKFKIVKCEGNFTLQPNNESSIYISYQVVEIGNSRYCFNVNDGEINKIYFISKEELLKHIINQIN